VIPSGAVQGRAFERPPAAPALPPGGATLPEPFAIFCLSRRFHVNKFRPK